MKLLKSFLFYLKKPELSDPVSLTFKQSINLLINSIPIYFIFIFCFVILFIPLAIFDLIPELPPRQLSDIKWIIVFGPVIEELIFRLPLRNFFKNIFIALALGFYALGKSHLGIGLSIALGIVILLLPYIPGFISRFEDAINNFIKKYFVLFFYLIAVIFGFMHITNLETIRTSDILFSPVIVAYQLFLGLYLGFIRIKYKGGIFYAILLHAFFNSIPVMVKLL